MFVLGRIRRSLPSASDKERKKRERDDRSFTMGLATAAAGTRGWAPSPFTPLIFAARNYRFFIYRLLHTSLARHLYKTRIPFSRIRVAFIPLKRSARFC